MNVFRIQQGSSIGSINAHFAKLAPTGAQLCVLEVVGVAADELLAAEVAIAIATSRSTQLVEKVVQGYQIGAIPEMRSRQYKLFFIG